MLEDTATTKEDQSTKEVEVEEASTPASLPACPPKLSAKPCDRRSFQRLFGRNLPTSANR